MWIVIVVAALLGLGLWLKYGGKVKQEEAVVVADVTTDVKDVTNVVTPIVADVTKDVAEVTTDVKDITEVVTPVVADVTKDVTAVVDDVKGKV
jgi:hypothetical protein